MSAPAEAPAAEAPAQEDAPAVDASPDAGFTFGENPPKTKNGRSCPSRRKCCRICFCGLSMIIIVLIMTMGIGLTVEANAVENAPSTARFYNTTAVCAKSVAGALTTRLSPASVGTSEVIQHCGECGQCSSDHDIGVMRNTAQTLTQTATRCAMRVFLGGDQGVTDCFDEQVGFTSQCTPCWVENVLCDQRACMFTCLWGILRGEPNNRDAAPSELSPCLRCDEKLCGPAFVTCAGANRRRSGITSDIGRVDALEMCNIAP